jgi:hypothetical protein
MPSRNRARALEMLAESERLEKELQALTQRLALFTEALQAQVAAKTQAEGIGDHVPTND